MILIPRIIVNNKKTSTLAKVNPKNHLSRCLVEVDRSLMIHHDEVQYHNLLLLEGPHIIKNYYIDAIMHLKLDGATVLQVKIVPSVAQS